MTHDSFYNKWKITPFCNYYCLATEICFSWESENHIIIVPHLAQCKPILLWNKYKQITGNCSRLWKLHQLWKSEAKLKTDGETTPMYAAFYTRKNTPRTRCFLEIKFHLKCSRAHYTRGGWLCACNSHKTRAHTLQFRIMYAPQISQGVSGERKIWAAHIWLPRRSLTRGLHHINARLN